MEGCGRDDGYAIDVASVTTYCLNSLLSPNTCIFRTPKLLLRNKPEAYVPTAFSIGPLHHGKPGLKEAEQIKLKYMRRLIHRVQGRERNANIVDDLVRQIASLEEEARQCYSVPVDFNKDEFVKILLVDGCFLIEQFRIADSDFCLLDEVISSRPFLKELVASDILLLENQIPWKVLDRLFSLTTTHGERSLISLALRYFRYVGVRVEDLEIETSSMQSTLEKSSHILDLLRKSLVWTSHGDIVKHGRELIPSASSLMEAGVKFKKREKFNGRLDIIFDDIKGVLEIPPIDINEVTEPLFRNLISFEQCSRGYRPRITNYAMLLDILINSQKDIDILRENEIIDNWLNPGEAAEIFNKLYNDTCVNEFYYHEVCQKVNKYCKRRWPKWRAMYVRNHFSSPWAIASQVLATVIFILTLLQTVFTIKSSK